MKIRENTTRNGDNIVLICRRIVREEKQRNGITKTARRETRAMTQHRREEQKNDPISSPEETR